MGRKSGQRDRAAGGAGGGNITGGVQAAGSCEHAVGYIKAYYQAFFWVLIDLIVELLGLITKPCDNQTES